MYHTVFRDGDLYRMYHRGHQYDVTSKALERPHREVVCTAESKDGHHWNRPELGLVEFDGSKKNNIIWDGIGSHNFTPFLDTNPDCKPDSKYKALGSGSGGLYAFKSPDGYHWSLIRNEPVITKGKFDSQNLAFWDGVRGEYREYHRGSRDGVRDIMTCTSKDFLNWTDPVWLEYPGAPKEHLYTNQITPYYRAPHIFIGFPTRYVPRNWTSHAQTLPPTELRQRLGSVLKRAATDITDGLLMTSRDGMKFKRWGEAFIRPGLQEKGRWLYGDNYQNWGIVETKSDIPSSPNELSIYASEGSWEGDSNRLRRYTLRIDGFVSVQAPLSGGEFVTNPLVFEGNKLVTNFSTSAAGSIRIEIQDKAGKPIEDFALADCPEIYGDTIEHMVVFKNGSDVSKLAGIPIRLRFVIKDADLYSIRFRA